MKKLRILASLVPMINEATRHSTGKVTMLCDAVLADGVIVKVGSDEDHVAVTTATTEVPLGIAMRATDAAEDLVGVELLSSPGTKIGTASANIAARALICATAAGKIVTLPATAGTYCVIGRTLKAILSGKEGEFESCIPYNVVVTGA